MLRFPTLLIVLLLFAPLSWSQSGVELSGAPPAAVPGRLLVLYRRPVPSANAEALARSAGARTVHHFAHLGITAVSVAASDEARAVAQLQANPQVALVVHDRYVTAHSLLFNRAPLVMGLDAGAGASEATATTTMRRAVMRTPVKPSVSVGAGTAPASSSPGASATASAPDSQSAGDGTTTPVVTTDRMYNSPQGWAVRAAGGYGDGIAGGAASGPWSTTRGAGVRIAILDSGVDENHPDIAPNLVLNMTEVNQTALPSACDDGSPQDQSGHGTWTASLAAGAVGASTGDVIGVAPEASILNIKVLERMPASGITDTTAACEAGQPGGLLSWVLEGIDDAVANHADVIALSLGTLVDTSTGDGAGLKAAFDQATWAATEAGSVVIAALGNDGFNLGEGSVVELPAQAHGVLAITASTNADCAENLAAGASCAPGAVTRPYYSNYDAALNAIAAPGGSYPEGATPANGVPTAGATGWVMGACSGGLTNTAEGLPANGQSFGCFNLGHAAYVQAMGTSASAALAAGAAAILRAARPELTAAQIIDALRSSATASKSMAEPELNLAGALAAQ